MLRPRLPQRFSRLFVVSALCSVACAQIAGFDHLSSRNSEDADGGDSAEDAGQPSIGGSDDGGGGRGPAPGTAGQSTIDHAGSGGRVSTGTAGSVSTGTAGSTMTGGGGNGGNASSAGSGGKTGSAGSTPTAGAAGAPVIGGCNAELLRNGDFEAGTAFWRQESTAPGINDVSKLIVKAGSQGLVMENVAPYAGDYVAWLGGVLDSDKGSRTNLLQDVQIPADVSKLVLSGWIQIKTLETNPDETSDQLDLVLQDGGPKYWSFHFWKGTEVTNGWKAFSYEISEATRLAPLRGRTLTFYAESIQDTSLESSFWVDSLSL